MHEHQLDSVVMPKRRPLSDGNIQNNSKRVAICSAIYGRAKDLLGAHVRWRAYGNSDRSQLVVVLFRTSQSKVEQHCASAISIGRDQNVVWLYVAMDDPHARCAIQHICNWSKQLCQLARIVTSEDIVQAFALNVLHRDPQHLVWGFAEGINGCGMVVDEPRGKSRLTLEPRHVGRIA